MIYSMTCNESCVREKNSVVLDRKVICSDTVLYIFAEQRLPRHMLNMRLWTRAPFCRRSANLKVFHDRVPNLQVVLMSEMLVLLEL